jgi:hypothetical protein
MGERMKQSEIINRESRKYLSQGLVTIQGYCYKNQSGKKGFIPDSKGIPCWKVNALQVIPKNKLCVIDIDSQEVSLPCKIPHGVPSIITQSGNRHFWFRPDSRLRASVNTSLKVDILTGEKPVLVPPSMVNGGGIYKWEVPFKTIRDLQQVPEALVQWLLTYQQPVAKKTNNQFQSFARQGNKRVSDLSPKQRDSLYEALEKCSSAEQGTRSNADFRFVCWGLSCGLSESELWNLCHDVSKFKTAGHKYFQITVKNALKKIH